MSEQRPQEPVPPDASFAEQVPAVPEPPVEPPPRPPKRLGGRWRLALDVLLFQGKLALDALRDLILSPISVLLAIYGAIANPEEPGKYFYQVMKWGRRSDHFIDLFSAGRDPDEHETYATLDDIVGAVETVIVDQEKRGGMTAEAKAHMERALHHIEHGEAHERYRLGWRVRRAAVIVRREARKVRDQIKGPGSAS